ncbi:MAG: VWA domain-containing protein [Gemmatimonadota bacterium]
MNIRRSNIESGGVTKPRPADGPPRRLARRGVVSWDARSAIRRVRGSALALTTALALSGCDAPEPGTGVFLLLDTSGTYAGELGRAQSVINYLLGTLDPGDSFGVARIDGGSFSEKDILTRVTFDTRPSVANDQKRLFVETVTTFADTVGTAAHTDITGGVLQAIEWLNEVGPGVKTVLIFSDMEEDLPEGHIRDFPIEMAGVHVIALNVTKLGSDNIDPREYAARLAAWQERVEAGGGEWTVINDLERLDVALQL